jgi:tetratricopeptide (TPR) repeat protein
LFLIVLHSNSASVVTIDLRAPARRALLILLALLAILSVWLVVRWYVADTLAEYAPDNPAAATELARLATRWAPNDPLAHWTLGALEEKDFSANNLADAVSEYKIAVTLSPNDYRYWMELGRGLEASGDKAGGERALGRAVELAPAYSLPRWYFGNLLLREGKVDEAFQQLARAGETNPAIRVQVFNLAGEIFGADVDGIANASCPSVAMRIQLAIYLAGRQKFAEAMRIWSSTQNRASERELADELKIQLIDAKQFRAALVVLRDIEPDSGKVPVPEQFVNGGFEAGTTLSSSDTFGWSITSNSLAQMSIDTQPHSGHNSLRIVFRAPNKLETIRVSQAIVVEPDTQYHFECYARTDDLISGSPPLISIISAADNLVLVSSPPLPTGTNDWQRIALDFKTKPNSDGVIVKLARQSCGEDSVCPIFGKVWYDDFNLQRSGGPAASRGTTAGGKREENRNR